MDKHLPEIKSFVMTRPHMSTGWQHSLYQNELPQSNDFVSFSINYNRTRNVKIAKHFDLLSENEKKSDRLNTNRKKESRDRRKSFLCLF